MLGQLITKHGDDLEDKSLTICSGTDYININYQHVVCPDAATAKVTLIKLKNIWIKDRGLICALPFDFLDMA